MNAQLGQGTKTGRLAGLKRAIRGAFETAGAGGVVNANLIGRNPLVDGRVADDLRRRAEEDEANDGD